MNSRNLLLILVIVAIAGGCISSNANVLDFIPTKDLPASLKFTGADDTTRFFLSQNSTIENATEYAYSADVGGFVVIEVLKLKDKNLKMALEDVDKKISIMRIGNFTEETITVEGIRVRHLQSNLYRQPGNVTVKTYGSTTVYGYSGNTSTSYVEGYDLVTVTDGYYVPLKGAFILVSSTEYPLQKQGAYDKLGLELARQTVLNLKKNKLL